jgi:flagellar capping protein FliD
MNKIKINIEMDYELIDDITIQNLIASYNSLVKYAKAYSEEEDSISKVLEENEDKKTIAALEHLIEYYGGFDWRNKYEDIIEQG